MKRFIVPVLVVIVILAGIMPALADSPSTDIILQGGFVGKVIGHSSDGKLIYQTDFSTPTYLPDLKTKIDTTWKYDSKLGAYTNGANTFYSFVSSEFVSVSDNTQKSIFWQPEIKVSSLAALDKSGVVEGKQTVIQTKAKLLSVDPLNANYVNNTLEWDYGNGVYRRLRLIEGMQQEYYVITKAIAGDFEISSAITKGVDFKGKVGIPTAWDADYNKVDISLSADKITLTKGTALDSKLKYPIIIDPDLTFTSSASDGFLQQDNAGYVAARTAAVSSSGWSYFSWFPIRNSSSPGAYQIQRSYLYFDTSALAGYTVTGTTLNLYVFDKGDTNGESIQVQSGVPMATYPHDPTVAGDYDLTNYTGNGGSKAISTFTTSAYNTITLNATGYGWVNTSGWTKFCLRTTGDINNSAPTGQNYINCYSYEMGVGYRPEIVVTYTALAPSIISVAASNVSQTTARLNSTITDDGGDPTCQIEFGYGLVSQTALNYAAYTTHTSVTVPVSDYDEGDNPYLDVSGLAPNTPYFFRVKITNGVGSAVSVDEQTFTTLLNIADCTIFQGFPNSTSISLSWLRGAGASQVLVRFASNTYPATTADGTQIYLGALSSYNHTGLVSGTTYYYTAWGESGGVYSSVGGVNLAMTTSATSTAGDELLAPSLPFGWYQNPDYTLLSNLEPFYSVINNLADDWGMPRNNMWTGIILLICTAVGLGLYIKFRAPALALLVMCVLLSGGVATHILPSFMIFFSAIFGIGAWATRPYGT